MLAVSLIFTEMFLNLRDLREKNQNFRTDRTPKRSFLFFDHKIETTLALDFCQNHTIFMKKVGFFSKIEKKWMF